VLGGYGLPAYSPLPPEIIEEQPAQIETPAERARAILESGGWIWKENEDGSGVWTKKSGKTTREIRITLTTASVPELKDVANLVKEDWEKLGIPTTLQFFEAQDLQQNVIRPREYEALLFGEVIGRELDLFAFWHASQRNDPGLNVSLYANISVDKLLEQARQETDIETQRALTKKAATQIEEDHPAAFIYVPSFVYVLPKSIKGVTLHSISTPSERFSNANAWYVSTEKVWRSFTQGRAVVTDTQSYY
jgi:peptide/nickel transport system substrate-binding protein